MSTDISCSSSKTISPPQRSSSVGISSGPDAFLFAIFVSDFHTSAFTGGRSRSVTSVCMPELESWYSSSQYSFHRFETSGLVNTVPVL